MIRLSCQHRHALQSLIKAGDNQFKDNQQFSTVILLIKTVAFSTGAVLRWSRGAPPVFSQAPSFDTDRPTGNHFAEF